MKKVLVKDDDDVPGGSRADTARTKAATSRVPATKGGILSFTQAQLEVKEQVGKG